MLGAVLQCAACVPTTRRPLRRPAGGRWVGAHPRVPGVELRLPKRLGASYWFRSRSRKADTGDIPADLRPLGGLVFTPS